MKLFKNYDKPVVPEDLIRLAILASSGGENNGEWALDWVGGDGPGWWRIMWVYKDQPWPIPTRSRALFRELEARGLKGMGTSDHRCVIAVHRCDRSPEEG